MMTKTTVIPGVSEAGSRKRSVAQLTTRDPRVKGAELYDPWVSALAALGRDDKKFSFGCGG